MFRMMNRSLKIEVNVFSCTVWFMFDQ